MQRGKNTKAQGEDVFCPYTKCGVSSRRQKIKPNQMSTNATPTPTRVMKHHGMQTSTPCGDDTWTHPCRRVRRWKMKAPGYLLHLLLCIYTMRAHAHTNRQTNTKTTYEPTIRCEMQRFGTNIALVTRSTTATIDRVVVTHALPTGFCDRAGRRHLCVARAPN